MALKLKKLDEQVIVITGASAASAWHGRGRRQEGAKVVLAARSEAGAGRDRRPTSTPPAAKRSPSRATWPTAQQVDRLAEAAVARFGRIDTWVNNAGLAIYGRLDEVSDDDTRRLFDINFWGVVNGSLAALPHLKRNGGALINVGSEVSEAYVPLLGHVLGVEARGEGVHRRAARRGRGGGQGAGLDHADPADGRRHAVPAARAELHGQEPKLPTPMIEPQQVADAILERGREADAREGGSASWRSEHDDGEDRPGHGATRWPRSRPTACTTTSRRATRRARCTSRARRPGVAGRTHGTGGKEAK